MTSLSQSQIDDFWSNGYLVVADAVSDTQLSQMRRTFASWVEKSRAHENDFGETLDGRARFGLEPGHCAEELPYDAFSHLKKSRIRLPV